MGRVRITSSPTPTSTWALIPQIRVQGVQKCSTTTRLPSSTAVRTAWARSLHLGEGHFKPDVQVVGVAVPKTPPIPV